MAKTRPRRLADDRARMAERALREGGYLVEAEGEALTADQMQDVIEHVLADLLHFARWKKIPPFSEVDLWRWAGSARDYFQSEGGEMPKT